MKKTIFDYESMEVFEKLPKLSTLAHLMEDIYSYYPGKIAVIDDNGSKTYDDLYHDTRKLITATAEIEVGKHVVVYCNNDYNFVKAALSIMASGKVAVLIPAQLDEKMVYGCLMKYQASGIMYENATANNVAFAKNALPNLKFYNLDEMDLSETSESNYNLDIDASSPACIVLTGGTTGRSKGALLSHKAILTGVRNGVMAVPYVFNQTYFSLIPLTHVFGLIRNLLVCLYSGSKIEFCTNMRNMFRQMPQAKPTVLILVPALAELFLNLIKQHGIGIVGGELKMIICGAATVPPYLPKEYHNYGVKLFPGYGLTEVANLVSGNPENLTKPNSVGLLFPNQEVKIVDQELWIKGDNLMIEYFNEPEENKLAFEDGWFKTGDLVEFDDEGFLYIIGRIKDIIVLPNGENVSPAYIEAKIGNIDEVQDCLVLPAKNEFNSTILTVEILPRMSEVHKKQITNLQEYFEKEIERINQTLLSYEQIQKVIIRTEDFKRSPAMKIIRPRGE